MGKFIYEAKNEKGQLVRGEVQAATEVSAEKALMKNHLIVTDLQPEKSVLSVMGLFNSIGVKDRATFARQLATMIDAGLPLVQALNIIALQTKNINLRAVLASVVRDIESGYSFSTALAKHPNAFNKVFVSVVRSGEATGKLDEVLLELADQFEKDASFAGKIKGALAYPIFIISAMFGVGGLMMVKVIPTIKNVFDEAHTELPFMTRALIALSDILVKYWIIVIVGIAGLLILLRFFFKSERGKILLDTLALKMPLFAATSTSIIMARMTRTLGLLISSGIPILEALRIVSDAIGNHVYQAGLSEVRAEVERGIPMSVPLMKNTTFPILFGQMVSVGEQTGRLDAMMTNLAKYYSEEADNKLKGMSSLIEPVVMVVLGVGVAILIFAILVPIYNISSLGA